MRNSVMTDSEEYHIEIVRSRRRTLGMEIRPDGSLLIRAPLGLPKWEIERFLREKQDWIEEHRARVLDRLAAAEAMGGLLSPEELKDLAKAAKKRLPERAAYFAERIGVDYGRIAIRAQRTRWGSCSTEGNLNFNCLLMLTPEEVQDYVVVHELCHRLEMNHSRAFWVNVERILPDYRQRRKWLKDNGGAIMDCLP